MGMVYLYLSLLLACEHPRIRDYLDHGCILSDVHSARDRLASMSYFWTKLLPTVVRSLRCEIAQSSFGDALTLRRVLVFWIELCPLSSPSFPNVAWAWVGSGEFPSMKNACV